MAVQSVVFFHDGMVTNRLLRCRNRVYQIPPRLCVRFL